MEMFTGKKAYAKYSTFSVGTESQKYKLTIGGYNGNASEIHNYDNVDAKIKFLIEFNSLYIPKIMLFVQNPWFYRE